MKAKSGLMFAIVDTSLADDVSLGSQEEQECPEVRPAKFQMSHLGPVSRRDRLVHQLERLAPYLSPVLLISVLILLPVVLSTICKVRQYGSEVVAARC